MKSTTSLAALFAMVLAAGTVPAVADWREGFGTYNVGLLSGENEADRLRRYECFEGLLAETLGVPVELFPAADYAGVMQGLLAGQLHHAGLGPSGYAGIYLTDPEAVSPVAITTNVDGSLGYYAVIYVRADDPAQSLEDLRGRSLAYADAASPTPTQTRHPASWCRAQNCVPSASTTRSSSAAPALRVAMSRA